MMNFTMLVAAVATLLLAMLPLPSHAQFKKGAAGEKRSKVQEVNFEEMTMKGTIRNPEGAFLVQKKGLKFYPLYEIQKDMDGRIRASEPDEVLNTMTNKSRNVSHVGKTK